jgi:hypothetical protein
MIMETSVWILVKPLPSVGTVSAVLRKIAECARKTAAPVREVVVTPMIPRVVRIRN